MPTSHAPLEPQALQLAHHPARWILATRPAFLTVTCASVLLGAAVSQGNYLSAWPRAVLALLLALLLHAAVNVINDVADHFNGTDAANEERVFPFTGGSRFIQNDILSPRQMYGLACGLMVVCVVGGVWLVWQSGMALLGIGFIGVVLGWGYSAPPLRLNSRGLGELCVLVCFWLVPQGMAVVLQGELSLVLAYAAIPSALLATAILFINQLPDRSADIKAGKMHWVARLPLSRARLVYALLVATAQASLPVIVFYHALPVQTLLALLTMPLSLFAAQGVWRHAGNTAQLRPAIIATILAANLCPLLLALGLLMG